MYSEKNLGSDRIRNVARDGLFDKIQSIDNFIDVKYSAPLAELEDLEKQKAEAVAKKANLDMQRQSREDRDNSSTLIIDDSASNISVFAAASEETNDQAEDEAEKQAENINKLGFDVKIHEYEGNGLKTFDVETLMPEKYKDRDPLELKPSELADAQEEAKKERSNGKAPGTDIEPVDMEKLVISLGRGAESGA